MVAMSPPLVSVALNLIQAETANRCGWSVEGFGAPTRWSFAPSNSRPLLILPAVHAAPFTSVRSLLLAVESFAVVPEFSSKVQCASNEAVGTCACTVPAAAHRNVVATRTEQVRLIGMRHRYLSCIGPPVVCGGSSVCKGTATNNVRRRHTKGMIPEFKYSRR